MADKLPLELKPGEGPVGVATKYDTGKVRTALYPMRAYIETCRVLTWGAEVYGVGNWAEGEGFRYGRLADAWNRHGIGWMLGENLDADSNLHHLGHLQCEVAFALESALVGRGKDDRANYQIHVPDENIDALMRMPEETAARLTRKIGELKAKGIYKGGDR